MTDTRKQFIDAYKEAMLWADLVDQEGNELDGYSIYDIDDDSAASIAKDCDTFLARFSDTISTLIAQGKYDYDQAGHDFWLTRQGHGAGFWDRGLGLAGDIMTAHCESLLQQMVYVNDGKVCVE